MKGGGAAGSKGQWSREELPLKPKNGKSGSNLQDVRQLKVPWPKSLADSIRATEQALHAAKSPVTPADLTKHFSRAKPTDLQETLENLVALGRARKDGERFGV